MLSFEAVLLVSVEESDEDSFETVEPAASDDVFFLPQPLNTNAKRQSTRAIAKACIFIIFLLKSEFSTLDFNILANDILTCFHFVMLVILYERNYKEHNKDNINDYKNTDEYYNGQVSAFVAS